MMRDVIERLRATVPALKLVDGAAGFQAAAESNPKVTPCAYVVPQRELPAPSNTDVLIQQVSVEIGVILVVRNLTDSKGVAAKEDLDLLRLAVKEQLYGWQPSSAHEPFERGPGWLLTFRDGHMWWQDIYQTSYYDRSVL